jgi:ankyrin repeat protein
MLAAGAKIDARDKDGWSALHAAAHEGNFGCATMLIDAGADRIAPDNSGQSAGMVAQVCRRLPSLYGCVVFGDSDNQRFS